jgi:hypothetical protein
MDMNARNYQKVITLIKSKNLQFIRNLSDRLEADSFHDYKLNIFMRELGKAYSNSGISAHECPEYYK